ncbi:Carbonic anhydrase, alpha-class [Trema orientale]|uniref:Carbonic anhydrase, alpha-class n=1 Tax=Trema orientale TaxID=63057 RepID=A0A2P5AZ15_TREOI|nr:Carbonic anhydrase, alpha-class [Trema orientale]
MHDSEIKYSYNETTGRGPSRWGQLDPSWYLCGNGTRQSPIDILRLRARLRLDLGDLQRDYKPTPATLNNSGPYVQLKWIGDAGAIFIDGIKYQLLHCHWHSPSEHKFNGLRFVLELHLVHKNSIGETAVVGIVYKYGQPNPFLSKVFREIRSLGRNGTREIPLGIVNPRDIEYGGILSRKYYRYNGSFSTPPCHEGVIWTLHEQFQTVSLEQLRALKEAVKEEFEINARPIQSLNGRPVYVNVPWMI